MAYVTPSRGSTRSDAADHTRQQEAASPSNFNQRAPKRQQRDINVIPPPRLNLGEGMHNDSSAASAISSQLAAIEREAKLRRDIWNGFAANVDKFVATYERPEYRKVAYELRTRVVNFLTTVLHDTGGASFAPQSQPTSSGLRAVTFADMAKTPTSSEAEARRSKPTWSSALGKTPLSASGGAVSNAPKREDRRLLISVEPHVLLDRPQPFALRQELCAKIEGLTLAAIPLIAPTRTGWAITPADLAARDLLLTPENHNILRQVLHATAVKLPEKWFNYAVPGVPVSVYRLGGRVVTNTAELVAEEVAAQTKAQPVSCRPSRHGADTRTSKITWIISFLAPVRPFYLFNASELAKVINKKPAITRHDPGCQGFCNPAKCTRHARCSNCSTRIDQHVGPAGVNCSDKAKCANCHGPFPAGHDRCPAAPKRKEGKIIKPTKKELDAIRRHGDREFRGTHAPPADTETPQNSQPQPQAQAPGANAAITKRKRGSVVTAYESLGSQGSASSSQVSSQSSSQPTSSRPRRSTVSGKNLNLVELSARSVAQIENTEVELSQESMNIDAPEASC